MVRIEAFCNVEEGRFKIIHRDKFVKLLTELKPGRYVLTVEKKYRKRSNLQNSYLWGIVYPIFLRGLIDLGYDSNEVDLDWVHDNCKDRFLRYQIVNKDGEYLEGIRSTKKLTTIQFMDYLADIKKWASEFLGVYVPDPGEELTIKF
ncbi:MAG: hypothetical protein WC139_13220 [Candidatus Kapaibacterium sp.]